MAVRGTSVARHHRQLVITSQADAEFEGDRIWCAWQDCDRYGYYCYQTVINEAKPGFPRKLARYVFCCEQHKDYFDHSHLPGEYGKLRGRFRSPYNL